MCFLLQLGYCAYFVEYLYMSPDNTTPGLIYWIGSNTFYFTDETAHSIFAIKFWALSLKIKEIVNRTQDQYLVCKVWTIFLFQMGLIVSTTIALTIMGPSGKYLALGPISFSVFDAALTLPPFIAFVITA